MTFYINKELV